MDYLRVIERLRPDVTWKGGIVDSSSLDSIRKNYQSSQPFPTNAEGIAAWAEIQAEDAAETVAAEQMADLEKVNTYLTNAITPMSISVADRTILRDTLLRMFKYLKYGK